MKRYQHIDTLRGFSILMIMLTHATSYFLSDKTAYLLWNASQFSVAVFIFCSFYLFFKKPPVNTRSYLKKRFFRLFIPYGAFLFFFIPLEFLHDPHSITRAIIVRYLTITTIGNDLSWLVLLFLQLTLVGVVIKKIEGKRLLFYTFFFLSLASSIIFLFPFSIFHFKLIMWLPWSLIIYFTWYFDRHENNQKLQIIAFIISTLIFTLLYIIVPEKSLYANKYPPNLYHLSYGISWILFLVSLTKNNVFDPPPLKNFLNFLSRYSYPLFFIHFLILYFILQFLPNSLGALHWWGFFGVLLFGSIGIQWIIKKAKIIIFSLHYKAGRLFGHWRGLED